MEAMKPSGRLQIVVEPMVQRSEAKDKDEDWTGKNSTALRRKLQNRLNKRASRRRKMKALQTTGPVPQDPDPMLKSAEHEFGRVSCLPLPTHVTFEISRRPYGHLPSICLQKPLRERLTAAPSFIQFMIYPLPVDQKLLTLLHFNLVRALTELVHLLHLDPERMNDDIESPWISLDSGLIVENIPEALRPTSLQVSIPHHPEADMFPFPEYRDNMILARNEIDDMELCLDVLYGVDPGECGGREGQMVGGRTGMIVWDDPWFPGSWEVEEGFARKWWRLVGNCTSLIESTNKRRRSRGEKPLFFEDR